MTTENKKSDGCFDMMHWGHANLCRQAKELGDFLIVGVHNDAEVVANKGPPVDLVVRDAPYYTSVEFCDKYNVDIIVHGDDISVGADGTDTYAAAKAAGRFKTVPRTIGVSSTDLVGRMLLLTKSHMVPSTETDEPIKDRTRADSLTQMSSGAAKAAPRTVVSQFLPSTRRLVQFSERREPTASDKVVYVDGGFDMFHVGHIEFLREARKHGTYLIVGVNDDASVNKFKGTNYPIMNLYERTLGVLSCRYVDEVIIGAPWCISSQMIDDLNIVAVLHGSQYEEATKEKYTRDDPYKAAKERGVYKEIESPNTFTTADLVNRIIDQRTAFLARQAAKLAKEEKLTTVGADAPSK